ncbi:hypothetical protein [uncultured Clostridium sp.]|uniref:hypothetical protein n=1 Tax=uncultured Clostridium sp. TaxID=59620 RepID=UPI0026F3DBB7|nr:hypothetical protein [uncultured Clostridium sp.]
MAFDKLTFPPGSKYGSKISILHTFVNSLGSNSLFIILVGKFIITSDEVVIFL